MNDLAENRSPSSSVGDYLKAVWELAVDSGGAASTKSVATRLSVSPASVTNMFARLQEMGLVRYERYRGATLTERGRKEALRLVRRHRLIETFLLEHLGYDWQEVHDEAERLEHAVSDGFTGRLAELLGHPDHDPHGMPTNRPSRMPSATARRSMPPGTSCQPTRSGTATSSSPAPSQTPWRRWTRGILLPRKGWRR